MRWIGISGPYDMLKMLRLMHKKGLHRRLVLSLMDHDPATHSPTHLVNDLVECAQSPIPATAERASQILSSLPPLFIFHGNTDQSVPLQSSKDLARSLKAAKCRVRERYYENKSHTDPIIEGPFSGDDPLMKELLNLIHHNDMDSGIITARGCGKRVLSKFLVSIAKVLNPF